MRRRTLLLGGLVGAGAALGGAALVEQEVLPGRVPAARLLGQDGTPGGVPSVDAGEVRRGSFSSTHRRAEVKWVIACPPDVDPDHPVTGSGARLPVCVVLHGRGGDAEAMVELGYPRFLAAAVSAGAPPFALASVDGGDRYWHPRRAGDDSGAMVVEEFLPMLDRAGLAAAPSDRVALLGWSMGGYGALLLAMQLGPARVAAIDCESPALWLHPGDSAPGAFDDREDFEQHDVFARTAALRGLPVRVACGAADPFRKADEVFAAALPTPPETFFAPGDHSYGFWRSSAPAALRFLGRALTP